MQTYLPTNEEALAQRSWVSLNAEDQVVGRLASQIATILRGKNKPNFTPHNDVGDFVVVTNAAKLRFSGNKMEGKLYYRHTGYVGGIKVDTAKEILERKPEEIICKAVKGMLPSTTLARAQLKKLKIYAGEDHPHQAQRVANIEAKKKAVPKGK